MRTFNFTLLAVFGYIATVGATALRAEAIGRRDMNVTDCNQNPNAKVCVICNDDPYQAICAALCAVYPKVSFCSEICDADPGSNLTFCESD